MPFNENERRSMGDDQMNESRKDTLSRAITNVIKNEALIEAQPSLEGLSPDLDSHEGGTIYYGTGLTTPKAIGVGLPLDVMGMILVSERLRRAGNLSGITHHIADTHAKTNTWIDPLEVDRRAHEVQEVLLRATSNLGMENFQVVLSSDFDSTPEYQEIAEHFSSSDKHEYVIREMADMEWYRRNANMVMKCGWIIQGSETASGFDERLFDREYMSFEGHPISFIYTKPGRTFDKSRPKASPYIQIAGENRLLLSRDENVRSKMESAAEQFGDIYLGGARKHLENIVRLYEKLFGSMGRVDLEDKLQMIIDKLTE